MKDLTKRNISFLYRAEICLMRNSGKAKNVSQFATRRKKNNRKNINKEGGEERGLEGEGEVAIETNL